MGKGRTGMNEVSVYMEACVKVWGKGGRGVGYISSLCIAL